MQSMNGNIDDLETRGTGYAETLSNVLKRLETEVYGPRGRE